MGVTNRHLFLLEVNLIKQTKIQTLRCLSKKLSLSKPKRRNWSTSSKLHPRRWQKATTTKEGQESQERQKEGLEIQKSQESSKGPKIPTGCKEVQKSPKRTK